MSLFTDRIRSRAAGTRRGALLAFLLLSCATALLAGQALAASGNDPSQVSFTLAGCRNDGSITLPNGAGKFVCPDAAYTTGNLGKGWNELDLVPFRLTAQAGNSAPSTQTYDVTAVLDNMDAGKPGYDVISAPVLNTALSDASCTAATSTGQLTTTGFGGIDQSIYRLLTISQAKNTTCVYDYFGRLAIGSHLFPGSSLHANLANKDLTSAGIGSKDVSIPVKEIQPQTISKTMNASQNQDHIWSVTKNPSPASVDFGNTCDPAKPLTAPVVVSVSWTKGSATPSGPITVITKVYATNPASRTITVQVSDDIRTGTTVLDTSTGAATDVSANTANVLVLTHTTTVPSGTTNLNDIATATYTDKATGVPVPGQTTATASVSSIDTGATTNETATIGDSESITGSGLDFKVGSTTPSSFESGFSTYTLGDFTTGPVDWSSGSQSDSGSVDFNKTVRVAAGNSTSGTLSDTATLAGSDGASATAGASTTITSHPLVTLTINKTIPNILQTGESQTFNFTVKDSNNVTVATPSITFTAGQTSNSVDVTDLEPGKYTVSEQTAAGWLPQAGDASTTINSPDCSGSVSFTNNFAPAAARVQKVTSPAGFEKGWTFDLKDSGGNVIDTATTTGTGFINFTGAGASLGEGTYSIVEETQNGWTSDGGDSGCSFTVNLPADGGKLYSCTYTNTYQPSITLTKTGTTLSKIGDPVNYTITLTNTSPTLGAAGAPNLVCDITDTEFPSANTTLTVAPGDIKTVSVSGNVPTGASDPFVNHASASCHYPNLATVVASANASASTNLFQPSITVGKSASNAYSKAGDTVTYTVTITNTSSSDAPALKLDSFSDNVVSGVTPDASCNTLAVGAHCTFTYNYTVQAGDPDPLVNTATAHYHPDGFTNDIHNSGSATVDLLHPSFTIGKVCSSTQPVPQSPGSATFTVTLTNTGDADLVIDPDEGASATYAVAAGKSTTFTVTKAWDGTSGTIANTVNATATLAAAYNLSNVLSSQSASASCTVAGLAKVVKTVQGAPPSGTQAFTFTLRSGASTTADGTILETKIANSSNGGILNFSTALTPTNHYQLCEDVMPGWNTTLPMPLFVPNSMSSPTLPNPNVNNMTVCTDFVAVAGQTTTYNVDNSPPPGGRALTIGFWKNWASCTTSSTNKKPILDQTLLKAANNGTPITIGKLVLNPNVLGATTACKDAVNLLNKTTIDGKTKKASDPLFNMAAQLVAADLNVAAGAGVCPAAVMAISQAQTLLLKYNFSGNTYNPKLTSADATNANNLATALDKYNNDKLC